MNTDAPLLASTSYEQWTADGVRVDTSTDPHHEKLSNLITNCSACHY